MKLSTHALKAMLELARRHRLTRLIAPVRPSLKERYPLVPIERYGAWRRADGLLFDPWMRVHERLGGTVLKPEPRSLRITGTVDEWEEWTAMSFPESGEYWFPRALATLNDILADGAADIPPRNVAPLFELRARANAARGNRQSADRWRNQTASSG